MHHTIEEYASLLVSQILETRNPCFQNKTLSPRTIVTKLQAKCVKGQAQRVHEIALTLRSEGVPFNFVRVIKEMTST